MYIDTCDYETKYLPMFKNKHFQSQVGNGASIIKKNKPNSRNLNPTSPLRPKKGTIPFYFPIVNKFPNTTCLENKCIYSQNNDIANYHLNLIKPRKGTIPFYFPILKKQVNQKQLEEPEQSPNLFIRK